MHTKLILAVGLTLAAGPSPLAAQDPPPFKSKVALVSVDAQVVDKDGKPVLGRKPEDLEVTIEGGKRAVLSAQLIEFQSAAQAAANGTPATAAEAEERHRAASHVGGDFKVTGSVGALLLTAFLVPQTGTLSFTAPDAWKTRPAASSMRVAEFVVPKVATDPEDADVVIYFFAGGGGSVDANIQRWIGQFEQPSGSAVKDSGRATFDVGNLKVTTVDVSGTYVAEVRPGATERHNKPNFRMRAAVVETPKGPYFIKLTGPAATVKAASPAFDQFLKTLRF